LISGGRDNKIAIHSTKGGEYILEKSIELEGSFPKALDYFNGKILAGLRNGSIFEINEATGEKKQLLASHHEGETWGLEVIPEEKKILTVGDDNKIMMFDYEKRCFVQQGKISEKEKPSNKAKSKKVTASTLSDYHPN
jgi:WD40 repeat protein